MSSPCLALKVEIVAGTHEADAAIALTMLATDMDVIVEAEMRETKMRAHPGGDWQKVLREFLRDERLSQYPND